MSDLETTIDDTYARDSWERYRFDTENAANAHQWLQQQFYTLFPKGHEESLRHYAIYGAYRSFQKKVSAWINHNLFEIHKDAWPLLIEYGTDYVPHTWDERSYKQEKQPVQGGCFANSYYLTFLAPSEAIGFVPEYVEGLALGAAFGLYLHAWVTDSWRPDIAYDWTLYPIAHWNRYYGIAFTREEYVEIHEPVSEQRNHISLFSRESFPFIKEPLLRVLARRQQAFEPLVA